MDKVSFIDTTKEHITELFKHLRISDMVEMKAVHGRVDIDLIMESVAMSKYSNTLLINDKVACIFGVARAANEPDYGCCWMLGTSLATHNPTAKTSIGKASKQMISKMFDVGFKTLYNYVFHDNRKSINWLKWCGFTFSEAQTFGKEGKKFYLFSMNKEDLEKSNG